MEKSSEITIQPVVTDHVTVWVVGDTPLILNRMSEKAKHELLYPKGRPNQAERASRLKHDPLAEFRASPYRLDDPSAPTLLALMSSSFKGAMATAALDLPGASRAQIGRLVWVSGMYVPVFGEPQVQLSVVRSADAARTPDIRTRAILPRWAAQVDIGFVSPMLKRNSVLNLLSAGGITSGVGDWRPEKGKGTFGQYHIVNDPDHDSELQAILAEGRSVQTHAMDFPNAYDSESLELLEWFASEIKVRGVPKLLTPRELIEDTVEAEAEVVDEADVDGVVV
jgi:hypothetical protein